MLKGKILIARVLQALAFSAEPKTLTGCLRGKCGQKHSLRVDVVRRWAESLAAYILLSSPVLNKLFLLFFIGLAKLFPHSFYCLLMIIILLTEEMYQVNLSVFQKVR